MTVWWRRGGLFCLLQAYCIAGVVSPVSSIPGNLLRGLVYAWICEKNRNFDYEDCRVGALRQLYVSRHSQDPHEFLLLIPHPHMNISVI
jgi:hypothetical protein